jgi:hypothetical protein
MAKSKDYTLKDYEAEDFTGYTTAGSAAVCTIMERARLELKSVADVGEEDNKAGWSLGFLPDEDTDEINA